MATEYCLTNPKYPVRYAAPTQAALKNIIRPIMRRILSDCPQHLKPRWYTQDKMYVFPNGAEFHISGCNNGHAENLRGTDAGIAIVDEAGFVDDLAYVVDDILMPQLLTTGGRLILSSTPPRSPAHEFTDFAQNAMSEGNYSEYNIHKAGYPKELVAEFCKEAGGENSTTWKREYLCQFVVDETYAVVPEWRDAYVLDYPKDELFQFYHLYEAMDVGGRDKHAVLFWYYDFRHSKTVIEDEWVIDGPTMTTELIAQTVKAKEAERWNGRPVYRRIADNNNVILLNDLGSLHDLHFSATSKDDLQAMVNELRLHVSSGRLIVHPRCKQTIGCLKNAVWTEKRDQFARLSAYGHFDALAALIYLIRNLDVNSNPIPSDFKLSLDTHYMDGTNGESNTVRALKDMLGVKK